MKGFRGPDTWPAATIDHVADPFFVDIEVVWDCGGSSHPVFRLIPTGSHTADGSELYFMGLAGHFNTRWAMTGCNVVLGNREWLNELADALVSGGDADEVSVQFPPVRDRPSRPDEPSFLVVGTKPADEPPMYGLPAKTLTMRCAVREEPRVQSAVVTAEAASALSSVLRSGGRLNVDLRSPFGRGADSSKSIS